LLFAHLDYHTTHLVSAHVFKQFCENDAIRSMSKLKSALSKLKIKIKSDLMPTEKHFVMSLKRFTDLTRPALCTQVGIEDRMFPMPPPSSLSTTTTNHTSSKIHNKEVKEEETETIRAPKTPPPSTPTPLSTPSSTIESRTYFSPRTPHVIPKRRLPPPKTFPSDTTILFESRVGVRQMSYTPSWSKQFLVLWSNAVLDTYVIVCLIFFNTGVRSARISIVFLSHIITTIIFTMKNKPQVQRSER